MTIFRSYYKQQKIKIGRNRNRNKKTNTLTVKNVEITNIFTEETHQRGLRITYSILVYPPLFQIAPS